MCVSARCQESDAKGVCASAHDSSGNSGWGDAFVFSWYVLQ
jgi:hypothetical protein